MDVNSVCHQRTSSSCMKQLALNLRWDWLINCTPVLPPQVRLINCTPVYSDCSEPVSTSGEIDSHSVSCVFQVSHDIQPDCYLCSGVFLVHQSSCLPALMIALPAVTAPSIQWIWKLTTVLCWIWQTIFQLSSRTICSSLRLSTLMCH